MPDHFQPSVQRDSRSQHVAMISMQIKVASLYLKKICAIFMLFTMKRKRLTYGDAFKTFPLPSLYSKLLYKSTKLQHIHTERDSIVYQ